MKKIIYFLPLVAMSLFSCDFILKQENNMENNALVIEQDLEANLEADPTQCAPDQGYCYSQIFEDCIRPFEIGFRLTPVGNVTQEQIEEENDIEQNGISCFVVVSPNKDKVEIYLPNHAKGILLNKQEQDLYTKDQWKFEFKPAMVLSYKDEVVFKAAVTSEASIYGAKEEEVI
ncbi:hypothetical protein ACYSNM_07650 [Myroides sp. LJL116]